MRTRSSVGSRLLTLLLIAPLCNQLAHAQEMEPRAYSNAPIDMNFLVIGYGYSAGGLLFDPSLPVQGAHATLNYGVLGFAHSFDLAGKSAKFAMVLPYAGLDANGYLDGTYAERVVSGFADPAFSLSVNFSGAPALPLKEFLHYRQETVIGATLKVTAPWGQYDADRLINIGTHRWSIKPEIGVSQALDNWVVEGSAAFTTYTSNNEFYGGQKLEQDPIYSVQAHVVYNFTSGMWVAFDATYYTGGESTVSGVAKDNKLDNWRYGLTFAMPVDKYNSIKFSASTGIITRTGTDFDAYLLAWQYRWGGGL
ncbi:MAG TPA: transporter [Gammaproteobacteria bacterium]|nr:transporter [Gammaproteobacteria bacterium]